MFHLIKLAPMLNDVNYYVYKTAIYPRNVGRLIWIGVGTRTEVSPDGIVPNIGARARHLDEGLH